MENVQTLLESLGIEGSRTGHQLKARCPNTAGHKNGDRNPSWEIVIDSSHPRYGQHHCWSCSFGGGPASLAALAWGCTRQEAASRLGQREKVVVQDVAAPSYCDSDGFIESSFQLPDEVIVPKTWDEWPPVYGLYALERGLWPETLIANGVGYATKDRLRYRLVFPIRDSSGIVIAYSARSVDWGPWIRNHPEGKGLQEFGPMYQMAVRKIVDRNPSPQALAALEWTQTMYPRKPRYLTPKPEEGASTGHVIYGIDRVQGAVATLVEGCLKTLLMQQAGWPNPLGLIGAVLTPERVTLLNQFDTIYIATDPDPAGDKVWAGKAIVDDEKPIWDIRGMSRHTRVERVEFQQSLDDLTHDERVALRIKYVDSRSGYAYPLSRIHYR